MWRRLLAVCEALATADEAGTLPLVRQLTGGVLEDACRSSLSDAARAQPTLARCVDLLTDEDLTDRVARFIDVIRRFDFDDEARWILSEVREEILGAIVAGLALRCSDGEQVGP